MIRIILILIGIVMTGPAMAQSDFNLSHAKSYYDTCKGILEKNKYDTRDTACVFYFKGWVDSFIATQGVMEEAMNVAPSVCLPVNFTIRQGLSAVLIYMKDFPSDKEPSAMIMMITFMKKWPCAKRPVPKIQRF